MSLCLWVSGVIQPMGAVLGPALLQTAGTLGLICAWEKKGNRVMKWVIRPRPSIIIFHDYTESPCVENCPTFVISPMPQPSFFLEINCRPVSSKFGIFFFNFIDRYGCAVLSFCLGFCSSNCSQRSKAGLISLRVIWKIGKTSSQKISLNRSQLCHPANYKTFLIELICKCW